MKTEQLRDKLARAMISAWAAKTYATPNEIANASAQAVIDHIAPMMRTITEELNDIKSMVDNWQPAPHVHRDVASACQKALASIPEEWRK